MTPTPQTEASRLADELRAELLVDIGSPYKTTNVSKRLVDESAAELRRLVAENQRQRADLERKSEAIQRLWAERDQLRTQVERLQSQPAAWECFLDHSYFDMWAVKRKDSRSFQDAFHVTSEVEAQRLCGLLNGIRQPAAPAMVALTSRQFDMICQAIDKADTISMDADYMLDSGDCIKVVRVMQALIECGIGQPAGGEGV